MESVLGKRTVTLDSSRESLSAGKHDKRRFNKGASQRRSYTNDEKLAVIQMRDSGMSYEAIAQKTGYSRVNMEKWCSQKGREVIVAKAKKWTSEKALQAGALPPRDGPDCAQRLIRSVSSESESNAINDSELHHSGVTEGAYTHDGEADDPSAGSGVDDGDDPEVHHVLNLVAKEECKERQLRRSTRGSTVPSPPVTNAAAASTTAPPRKNDRRRPLIKTDGERIEINLPDDITALSSLTAKREFVKKGFTDEATSDFTMTISDTMLKMDYFPPAAAARTTSAPSAAPPMLFNMSTSVQATRPIVANTKFFRAINDYRKKRRAASGIATRSRVMEELNLSEGDSEQEKEDNEMMLMLGE